MTSIIQPDQGVHFNKIIPWEYAKTRLNSTGHNWTYKQANEGIGALGRALAPQTD